MARKIFLFLLFSLISVLAYEQIAALKKYQQLTTDRAELKHVKYGMLNADNWVGQVTSILEKKIDELEIEGEGREALKNSLERILTILIEEAHARMKAQERTGGWWSRTTKQFKGAVRESLVDIDTVKAGVPQYAEEILRELDKPDSRRELSRFLAEVLEDISQSTFALVDPTVLQGIYARYQCEEKWGCLEAISAEIKVVHSYALQLTGAVLMLTALMLISVWMSASVSAFSLSMLTAAAFVLMLCGVLTPMIEVEAQISDLRFTLLGEPVFFTDEVFYFQSKSVLDVVAVLTATGAWDMVLVGLLIMVFSVIFPLTKMAASILCIYRPATLGQQAVIRFFAYKSGKWSMADVMVVAIFMAYIGFNGLISSQLGAFTQGAASAGVEVLTTNGTSLQIGFFMFLAYCIFSLMSSTLMENRMANNGLQSD